MGMPVLSAKVGRGAAWRHTIAAYRIGQTGKSLGRGAREVFRNPFKQRQQLDYNSYWRQAVSKEADGKELLDVLDAMDEHGVSAEAGVEADAVSEADMNKLQVGINRMVGIASQLPLAAETINRNTTAIATYRAMREQGKSHEDAKREAVHTVEATQGGYDANNHAAWMANPILAPFAQFRKFSVTYGQSFYRNLAWMISHQDPAQRKQSRQTVVRLALTGVVFAGIYGNPLMEIARMLVNTASALFGFDDWEEDEVKMQQAFGNAVEWATGSDAAGDAISEMLFRGSSRAIDLDLSGAMGANNLFLFGQPKEWNEDSVYAYMAKTFVGAPGDVLFDAAKAVINHDVGEFPWPKLIQNMRDAIGLMNDGIVNKRTGEQYAKPPGLEESVYKALGLRAASESRQFEGGTGTEAKRKRAMQGDRRDIMEKWSFAAPGERARIWKEEVRAWNSEHKGKERITMDNLVRSRETRKKRRKELEKAAEED